jgi:hypothetical protein
VPPMEDKVKRCESRLSTEGCFSIFDEPRTGDYDKTHVLMPNLSRLCVLISFYGDTESAGPLMHT